MEPRTRHFLRSLALISLSIAFAVFVARYDLVDYVNGRIGDLFVMSAFVAGLFFTSLFTTAPAVVVLGALSQDHSPFLVAFIGAAGALCGDAIIFRFFKDRLSSDFEFLLNQVSSQRLRHLTQMRAFRWLLPLLGALVIASPLPDELGLFILGISRMPNRLFVPLSYTFNFLGILLIGLFARAMLMR